MKVYHYPVVERFHSFQGEGVHMGRSAFFIRTYGCPVQCPWCDSAGTWHKDYIPKKVEKFTAQDLAQEAAASKPAFVVLTGGEPLIHPLNELLEAVLAQGLPLHIETSGAFKFTYSTPRFWLTVSPKWARLPEPEVLAHADELKLIVEDADSIPKWMKVIERYIRPDVPIWLHPEWSKVCNTATSSEVLNAITQAVKSNARFRAGWQLHKLYRADSLDARTSPLAPLGGNPKLGY